MRVAATSKFSLFRQYDKAISDPVTMVMKAAEGLSVSVFDRLIRVSALNTNQLAIFIGATPKTIDKCRLRRHKLGRVASEQLLRLVGLYKKGYETFGNAESFNQWLKQAAAGLGGIIPFDLLYTQGGINMVMEELFRIEYGAVA